MAAVTDLIRVILPAWERSLPFHPCNLTFIHSTIEAKVSLLTLVLISGAPRDFSELTIWGTFRDLPRALFSPYSQQVAGLWCLPYYYRKGQGGRRSELTLSKKEQEVSYVRFPIPSLKYVCLVPIPGSLAQSVPWPFNSSNYSFSLSSVCLFVFSKKAC